MKVKHFAPLLAIIAIFGLLCPCCVSARFSGMANKREKGRASPGLKLPSEQDNNLMRMRAVRSVTEEMGQDADESAMLKRVDEVTEELLKEAFPDAYLPPPQRGPGNGGDNVWENGTVVRYIARAIAFVLAMMTAYACKEQIMGRETFDGKKMKPSAKTMKPPATAKKNS